MTSGSGESVISCAEDQAVWPWQAEPYRLWSLLDMQRHLAGNWLALIGTLERIRWLILLAPEHDRADSPYVMAREEFEKHRRESFGWMKTEFEDLPFTESLRKQYRRLMERLSEEHRFRQSDALQIVTQIDELKFNIQSELEAQLFFVVPTIRKPWFHEGDAAIFGNKVSDAFPDSTPELAEAGRCLALARWTACVFHLMRALELALHKWALELGVTQFSAIELENWKTILDAAEKRIRALEQQPKSMVKDAELKYYSETLGHFRSVKDAWRNHVAHARERYDEERTLPIANHVREFMRLLAERP